MTDSFVAELRAALSKKYVPPRDVHVWRAQELPVGAWLGTIWMISSEGSVIEFYSWIDSAYCHGPLYATEEIAMTAATVHHLTRMDRAFLKKWDDFVLYDRAMYHQLIARLQRAGFQIYVKN